jgi:hypothetical protein
MTLTLVEPKVALFPVLMRFNVPVVAPVVTIVFPASVVVKGGLVKSAEFDPGSILPFRNNAAPTPVGLAVPTLAFQTTE